MRNLVRINIPIRYKYLGLLETWSNLDSTFKGRVPDFLLFPVVSPNVRIRDMKPYFPRRLIQRYGHLKWCERKHVYVWSRSLMWILGDTTYKEKTKIGELYIKKCFPVIQSCPFL